MNNSQSLVGGLALALLSLNSPAALAQDKTALSVTRHAAPRAAKVRTFRPAPAKPALGPRAVATTGKTIPMDFSGMDRRVQDMTAPSHAHSNASFGDPGGGEGGSGLVPSTTFKF